MFEEYRNRLPWADTDHDISPQQTAFAAALRVPILSTEYPRWNYITGIVVRDEQYLEVGVMPTEDEITQVATHLESYSGYYNQAFRDVMREFAPYDIDGGANLGYYIKRPDGGWMFRKRTWSSGAQYWPQPGFHHVDRQNKAGNTWDSPTGLPLSHVLMRNFNGWSFLKRQERSA